MMWEKYGNIVSKCKKMELERPKCKAQMQTARDLVVKKGFCKCLGSK